MTTADIAAMNRATVSRSAVFLRLAGTGMVIVGTIGVALWGWFEVRAQQHVSGGLFAFNTNTASVAGPNLAERIDFLASSMSLLMTALLVVGGGLAARHLSDYTRARTGTSLTGFEVGDAVPSSDE